MDDIFLPEEFRVVGLPFLELLFLDSVWREAVCLSSGWPWDLSEGGAGGFTTDCMPNGVVPF